MKPFESILVALIITIILFITIDNLANSVDVHLAVFTLLLYFLGGVLATGLSKEYKIRYGLYYGLITASIYSFFFKLPLNALLIIILGTLGGFIIAMTNEKYRLSFFNKYEFHFNPLVAVIMGVVITFLCFIFLTALAIIFGYNASANVFETILYGAISLIMGSFASTFVSKDKKIQYGIYSGIIFIIYRIIWDVVHINNVQMNYYLIISITIGYLFLVSLGSYLATNRKLNSFH